MARHRFALPIAAAALLALAAAGTTGAQVFHVAPGQDLQAAVDAAPPGAVLVLKPGPHRGPVVVPRRMTLRGQPGAQLIGTGAGSVLTITGQDVHIERLHISRSGRNVSTDDAGVLVLADHARIHNLHLHDNLHGIYVRSATHLHLLDNDIVGLAATQNEGVRLAANKPNLYDAVHDNPPASRALMGNGIHLFNAHQAVVAANHIRHVRDGIYVAHTSHAVFRDNRIHDARYGIHYMYSSNNVIQNNELWRNVAGPALMFSHHLDISGNVMRDHAGLRAYGLLLQNIDDSRIDHNDIRGNRIGVRLQHSSGNRFSRNRIGGNLTAMTINSSSRDNRFTRNTYGFNLHQVELTGPAPHTQWSVDGVGNHWHGAMPLDLSGDAVSEWPHHEVDLIGTRRETFPPVQLLIGSPGIRALEWALRRAPTPGLHYVTDPHPLTRQLDQPDPLP